MKIIFVLDDMSVLISTPEELLLQQFEEGKAVIGLSAKNEEGHGTFMPLLSYPVYLSSQPLPPGFNPNPPSPLPEPAPQLPKNLKKKKAAK